MAAACSGYLANPMEQARASTLPLASIAALLRGDDPAAAWASTRARISATVVSMNLMPGVITCDQALQAVLSAVPVEAVRTLGRAEPDGG